MTHDPAALALARKMGLTLSGAPSRPASGATSALLRSHGWARDDTPGHPGYCGVPGDTTGDCHNSARWVNAYGVRRCAGHAKAMVEADLRRGG